MTDWEAFLVEIQKTELEMQIMMHDGLILDCINNRKGLILAESPIHGIGVFTKSSLPAGHKFLAMRHNTKFMCGRFINHSTSPNMSYAMQGGDGLMVCRREIHPGEELLADYRESFMYRWLKGQ